MSPLDLDLVPPTPASPAVLSARRQRALVAGLGGGRGAASPPAGAPATPRRPSPAVAVAVAADDAGPPGASAVSVAAAGAATRGPRLDEALVVPAGAVVRGYLRCHALLLVGDVVGNVHCTAGPVVVRAGARLAGRLVAAGDVYVRGSLGDAEGGAVITTPGRLVLAPGARVDGDVRCGRLDVHEGATLNGVARRCED